MFKKRMKRITPGQMIILSFATMIFIGACLLMLPFSTNDGKGAPFLDALFTSTSASCVTGLIMHDTAQYWSSFGQLIILILIQIGGMGVITMAILLFVLGGKKIGFKQRYFMQQFKEYTDYSIGFLTRGCFRKCQFCVNQKYNHVFLHSPLKEFLDESRKKICLLDDNFLGCKHWKEIFLIERTAIIH